MSNLPKGWELKTLGQVASWGSGGTPQSGNSKYYGGTIPWAVIGDLTDGDVLSTEKTITDAGLSNSSAKLVPAGAILIAMYGSIGKLGIAKISMATNQAIAFAVPDQTLILDKYLFYYLLGQREIFLSKGKGATQQNISQTLLKSWEIPVPPLEEQKRIVEALDSHLSKLDKGLVLLEEVQRKLKTYQQSQLNVLFAGSHEQFSLVPLSKLGKWVTGSTPPSANKDYVGSDVPFVTPGDLKYGNQITSVGRMISSAGADAVRRIPSPSVQLVCIGATLGKVGLSLQEVTTNQQITSLIPDSQVVSAGYATSLLASPLIQSLLWEYSSSTTVPILNKSTLERVQVPLAPFSMQAGILEASSRQTDFVNSITESVSSATSRMSMLRRAILHRAFSRQLSKEN